MIIIPNSFGSLLEHGDPNRPGPYPHKRRRAAQPGAAKAQTAGAKAGSNYAATRPKAVKVRTIEEAVTAVLAGRIVELMETKQVNTLLDRLAAIANDAKARGEKAPNYDLCNVSVRGTNLFCVDKLRSAEYPEGVPRIKMPQMGGLATPGSEADKLPKNKDGEVDGGDAFVEHLRGLGLKVEETAVPAAKLKASQAELVGPKVAGMMTAATYDPGKKPIFVSRDGYVVDGHHRWAAVVGRDAADGKLGDLQMRTIVVDAPISEVLKLANEWSAKFGIQQKSGK